jgi:hypothetical protein
VNSVKALKFKSLNIVEALEVLKTVADTIAKSEAKSLVNENR